MFLERELENTRMLLHVKEPEFPFVPHQMVEVTKYIFPMNKLSLQVQHYKYNIIHAQECLKW